MYEKCGSELERPYPSPKGKKKAYKLGDRFCFHIPQQGTVYVHNNTAGNEFIKELVNLVADMAVPWMKSWICSILILIMSLQKKWTTGNSTA